MDKSDQRVPANPGAPTEALMNVSQPPAADATCRASKNFLVILERKVFLSIPTRSALDSLIQAYILYVHPTLPLLDEAELWDIYNLPLATTRKLLLLYVSLDILQRCGFRGKHDARESFYKRAKYLYNLDIECPLARAQIAVILSHHTCAQEPRAGSEWLALAIHGAQILDGPPEHSPNPSSSCKKRIWWSIVLRDRALCLSLHRRSQVLDIPAALDAVDDSTFDHKITHLCHYALALALSDMMSLVYASHGISTISVPPSAFEATISKISRVKATLGDRRSNTRLSELIQQGAPPPVLFTACISLAHFELLIIETYMRYISCYGKMISAAAEELVDFMTKQISVLERLDHSSKNEALPLSVAGCLPLPLITTAINISLSPSPWRTIQLKRRSDTLGKVMRGLEESYEGAAMISTGMSQFMQLAHTAIQLCSGLDEQGSLTNNTNRALPAPGLQQETLSLGQLPRTDSLPDLLTCLLPASLRLWLPWDDSSVSTSDNRCRRPVTDTLSRPKNMKRTTVHRTENGIRYHEKVNLDYLDLRAAEGNASA
ncbi:hypothetical protein BDV19DRAFT_381923 [Aspergillus venezuelensis]